MPKVFFFGNLPIWVGGKQTSGASVAMWQMANNINQLKQETVVDFVATDFFFEKKQVQATTIYGWNYSLFFKNWLAIFFSSFKYVKPVYNTAKQNEISFVSAFVKTILFDAIVRKNKQALFHIHGADYFIILKNVLHKNKIAQNQLLYTVHAIAGNDVNIPTSALEKTKELQIAAYNLGMLFFVSSQLQQEWTTLYGSKKSMVIPNGIDELYLETAISNLPNKDYCNKITLVTIGSLTERKGQLRVLQALKGCVHKEKIYYQCIGSASNDYVNELNEFATANAINFIYLGVLPAEEIIHVLKQAQYMILPSSSEGFGLVYLESLCTGTPVILPKNLPIVSEAKLNTSNAILLEDYSSNAIQKVLDDIYNYTFNAQVVAQSVQLLSWRNVANMYLEQYQTL